MTHKYDGGPAFPIPLNPGESCQGHGPYDGMTLRDYFAAKAMQGALANPEIKETAVARSEWAYEIADAMLKARREEIIP